MIHTLILAAILQVAQLKIGKETLIVEIAKTKEDRDRGLMERTSLPEGRGMLFVFEKAAPLSFWMKNTRIPLSIGFFSQEKILINIEEMSPPSDEEPLPLYHSKGPAQYALEVPSGWFQEHQIDPGEKFSFLDPLK